MYLEVPPSELKPKYDRFPLPYDVQLLYVNSHSSLTAAKIITSFTLMILLSTVTLTLYQTLMH